jgi:hypothetical protein
MINALIVSFGDQGVDLGSWGGAEGTRTPDPHTARDVVADRTDQAGCRRAATRAPSPQLPVRHRRRLAHLARIWHAPRSSILTRDPNIGPRKRWSRTRL